MKKEPQIIILSGGIGPERDVSLRSGQALFDSLSKSFSTQLHDMRDKNLPESLSPDSDVIFPIIHGEFGEDGGLNSYANKKINDVASKTLRRPNRSATTPPAKAPTKAPNNTDETKRPFINAEKFH